VLILALDGNSLAYRAFFALPDEMATASGQTTNAVYGFTTMLLSLVKEHRPDGIVVAFDRPEPTFRHEAIPEYKAQREGAPETLRQQMGVIRELLDVLGVVRIEMPGFEGDDIIATVARRAADAGSDVIVVTGDRDCYQLVEDPRVRVLYNMRGVSDYALYDEAGILAKTGVTPAQYPQYAALRGDPSDNLAGVPGVGEKTAAKLINTYGDVSGILANLGDLTPKLRESLEAHGDRALRNCEVMVLRRDVPLEVDLAATAPAPDLDGARRLFEFLEFRTMHKRLVDVVGQLGWATRGAASPATGGTGNGDLAVPDVAVASAPGEVTAFLGAAESVCLSARWSGEPGRGDLVGLAVHAPGGSALWVPAEICVEATVLAALAEHGRVFAHDAKPILRSLMGLGGDVRGLVMDTAIAAYLLNPSRDDYALADVALDLLGVALAAGSDSEPGRLDLGGEPDPVVLAAECAATAALAELLREQLAAESVEALYDDVENPLVRVLARMEHLGIGVDVATLESIRDRLTTETRELTEHLHEVAGGEFNLNSPVQLRKILYEDKGLTPGKKTKTGYSTDAATLEKLRGEWPEFIEPLLRYREIEKLRSTYGEGLLAEVAADGRIHATFNQTVARTGRLSSDHPNLHNIPVRTPEGRVFRDAFVPSKGCRLLVADYNQIELRCIAHLAGDPGLVAAFRAGEDIHTATAARVFSVDPSEVTHEQRSKAKMVSYGLAYGMEAYGLSQRLGIEVDEAAGILDSYFAAFPSVKSYMDRTVAEARQRGYTETLFGRRRPIPELLSDNFRIRQAGERQAMNAAIQGLAADVFKIALVRLDAALAAMDPRCRIVLQVHDEVLVESPPKMSDEVTAAVLAAMHGAAELDVPLEVNLAWGETWGSAKS
jgi:DNA polymerase-1